MTCTQRAAVAEVWLVDPADPTLTVHRLEDARCCRPIVLELKGRTAIGALAGASVDWERLPPTSA